MAKHTVTAVTTLRPDGRFPQVRVTFASGRSWEFRMTDLSGTCKTYLMVGRGTAEFSGEYKVARETADMALTRAWAKLQVVG